MHPNPTAEQVRPPSFRCSMRSSLNDRRGEIQRRFAYAFIAVHDQSMELRQLDTFAAVARRGGFTRAAEHLRLAQSAVFAQGPSLGGGLGGPLFARPPPPGALPPARGVLPAPYRRLHAGT